MDLFIKSVVAQCGLRRLSEAFEGVQGLPSPTVLLEANTLNPISYFVHSFIMLKCYFVLLCKNKEVDSSAGHAILLIFTRCTSTVYGSALTISRWAAASKGGNAFEMTLLHCGAL